MNNDFTQHGDGSVPFLGALKDKHFRLSFFHIFSHFTVLEIRLTVTICPSPMVAHYIVITFSYNVLLVMTKHSIICPKSCTLLLQR